MRVINYPEIMELISDIEKVTTSFASNCTSLTSADCIFKTEDKTFILNKFNPFFEGGYLFYHLKNSMTFNETKIKLISAQIINIIIHFHKNIEKHMNFSPENFILDKDGFVNYLWFEIDQKLYMEKCRPKILKPLEYIKINNDWYNLGVLMYELFLNLNPDNFRDKNGNLKYPRFIDISEEIKEFIEKLMSMKNENDELSLEEIKGYKFFEGINFDDILNRKFDSEIKPMNLEMQRINNLGIVTDEQIDENEEKEKERYTLFNYDSEDEDSNES
jgi:serine/threonine protein kinase